MQTPMPDLRERLVDPGLAVELRRLGLRPEDLPTVLEWARSVARDDDDLARLAVLDRRLARLVEHPERIGEVFEPCDDQHHLGRGVLGLLALVLAAPRVRAAHRVRGIDPRTSNASLADLGQQVWKDRQVNGSTGLHNHHWLTRVWAGRYLRLGRLQFELTCSDVGLHPEPVPVLAVHVDESGPLHPGAVEESLAVAPAFFAEHFPEQGPLRWITCESWLLDPALAARMPGSNLASFARRFQVHASRPRDRDAFYFGFGIEPEQRRLALQDLDSLPADTALRRAVLDIWHGGEHVMLCRGRLPVAATGVLE